MTGNELLVAGLLADPDPRLKVASEYPELRNRIKIFLDGEDVTGRCRSFSIPGRTVELYVRDESGRTLMDWTCRCGTTRSFRHPLTATFPGRICSVCGEKIGVALAIDARIGVLAVVPADELPPVPLTARFADAIADRWFRVRLQCAAMRGRLLRLVRRALE